MLPANLDQIIHEIELIGFQRWLEYALMTAFLDARKAKLATLDENKFDVNAIGNILRLVESVRGRYYEPGSSIAFVIFEPMIREIFAAPFRDRVIHHFLYNMQAGWWDSHFIYDSYSCRLNKGTLMGIKRAQRFMQIASSNFTKEAFVVKLDLKGYFMSIPHAKLLERIKWGLDRQFANYLHIPAGRELYETCLFLWTKIVMDEPIKKAHRRGPLDHWDPHILPPEKSLYTQPPGYGLVIGNLTSQLSSNIYLDQLDQLITKTLGYKCYGRYVDDFFIMVDRQDFKRLKADIPFIESYVKSNLDITLHPTKRYIQPINHGMPFLGARIYPHCLIPSDRLQAKYRNVMREFCKGYKGYDNIQAYLGLMKHLNSNTFIRQVFEEIGFGKDFWDNNT